MDTMGSTSLPAALQSNLTTRALATLGLGDRRTFFSSVCVGRRRTDSAFDALSIRT
jgi:hypothetical protein